MRPPSRRPSFEIALALALAATAAAVDLGGGREGAVAVAAGASADAVFEVPFRVDQDGGFYAKVLSTPWNPVHPGAPNGTVADDRSRGVSGWWVSFVLADADGVPVGEDAFLGAYVDSTPTRLVPLEEGAERTLLVVVHVPEEAAVAGAEYRVPVALAHRPERAAQDASGGRLDESRGYTAVVQVTGIRTTPGDEGGGAPARTAALLAVLVFGAAAVASLAFSLRKR